MRERNHKAYFAAYVTTDVFAFCSGWIISLAVSLCKKSTVRCYRTMIKANPEIQIGIFGVMPSRATPYINKVNANPRAGQRHNASYSFKKNSYLKCLFSFNINMAQGMFFFQL